MRVKHVQHTACKLLIAIEDNPKEILFTTPISVSATVIPRSGNILSYGLLNSGNFDTITSPMLIIGAEPDTDGFNLTLADLQHKHLQHWIYS